MQPVLKLKTYMDMFRQKRTRAESSIKSTAKRKRFQTQSGSDSKVTCAKSYKLETMVITTDSLWVEYEVSRRGGSGDGHALGPWCSATYIQHTFLQYV